MFRTSLLSFLVFLFSSWMVAAVNTNEWLPPDFVLIPENPRVLIGLLAVYVILLATSFVIYLIERMVFSIGTKLPAVMVRWTYNILFLVFSFAAVKFVWVKVSNALIFSGFYEPYAAQFYFSSGISPLQINGILLFTFLILLLNSFFFIRRYVL
ncbi:hypothetical protein KAR26_02840 [Candidatus Parcubacteria bacterium]|nr:hypothetical protein [Candidatus Parcubacteria bacterium]